MNNLIALDEALSYLNEEEYIPEIDYDLLVKINEANLIINENMELEEIEETVGDLVPGAKAIADTKNKIDNINDLKNQWKKIADKFTMHKWIDKYIKDDKEELIIHNWYERLCDPDIKYDEYKRGYKFFCNLFGIPSTGTIIEWIEFRQDKVDKVQKKVSIRYSRGLAKINIPDNMVLYHSSPAAGITKLIPSFKSKTKGKFLYPSKRVFFTVQKEINPFKYGLGKHKYLPIKDKDTQLYLYTPKKRISTVYIDPTYSLKGEINSRSVYVETNNPIEVIDITKMKKDSFGYVKGLEGKK